VKKANVRHAREHLLHVVSGPFTARIMPFIKDMIAYMKDMSHTVLIKGTPGVISIETDKSMKTNGAGVYYLPEHKQLDKYCIDNLGCSNVICYDTNEPIEGFEVSVHIVFSDHNLTKFSDIGRHNPLFIIMASDIVSSEPVDIFVTVPLKYRDGLLKQEQVTDDYHNTPPLVVRRTAPVVTDISVLAISVKRMIRGLI